MPVDRPQTEMNILDEAKIIPHARAAQSEITSYYASYSSALNPLSNFAGVPQGLAVDSLPNGDKFYRNSDQQEVVFDVIAMVVAKCLEAPPRFAKTKFAYFRRWIRITAADEPSFVASLEASESLYNYLASDVQDASSGQKFLTGGVVCFRPSAAMLTSTETFPDATAVDFPPLENRAPFDAAILAGHGKFIFSSENEILFMRDEVAATGDVVRREVAPNKIRAGQIVQVSFSLRLLKQGNGSFTRREVLKGVYILSDGVSSQLARERASARRPKMNRDAKSYTVQRDNVQNQLVGGLLNAKIC